MRDLCAAAASVAGRALPAPDLPDGVADRGLGSRSHRTLLRRRGRGRLHVPAAGREDLVPALQQPLLAAATVRQSYFNSYVVAVLLTPTLLVCVLSAMLAASSNYCIIVVFITSVDCFNHFIIFMWTLMNYLKLPTC